MSRNPTARGALAAGTALTAAALLAGCSSHSAASGPPAPTTSAPDVPGRADVQAGGSDLTITKAVAHLDPAGTGTLTMTVHNGAAVPEHLDMVATPDAGRGALSGAAKGDNGAMTDGGILLPAGSTVTFGGTGPSIRLTAVHGITAAHTLPLFLQFGVARLVHVSAIVSSG
jgi:copper(I)-binding protein